MIRNQQQKKVNRLNEFLNKVGKTLAFHSRQVQRRLRDMQWNRASRPAYRPIIVVGCSRAGTTLVYKTLSESKEIGSLQRETHDYWTDLHPPESKNWDTHALDAEDASAADRDTVSRYFYSWTGQHRWVDKNNQNGLCIPYLAALFPDAVFVYIKRSAGDNLNSLIEGWRKPGEFATWSADLPAKVSVEGNTLNQWCFFLAEGWRDYVNASVEEVAAFQYVAINQAILEAKASVPAGQWVEVFYEDFLRDPVATFRQVFEGCGLDFDSRLQTHCAGVLDIPYNAFSEIRRDKWKDGRNRDKIDRELPKVEEVAKRMGY
ncbi:MAG: sulfotransferase [Sulfuriferula multivorans]|uniref:Sulfotransferase n=1 Tax=Sulfuriferula multivorans TaxID=1559896 RepID=A0A7C9KY00_9PROT|nr:sulfotransferase [Sulfuriferula multivorans]